MKKIVTIVGLFVLLAGVVTAADFSSWQKKMPITFTGYNPPGGATTLTNFPVLVVLSTNISGFSYGDFKSLTNQDLRFTAADGTSELNYEIEKWDTNGSSYVWLQVTNLVDANTYVWAYWGRSGTTAPAYTTNGTAWDSSYAGVWHMTNTNPPCSVAGGIRGTRVGNVALATGQVADALRLANTNTADYVKVDGTGLQDPDVLTVSAWVKLDPASNGGVIYGHRSEGARLIQLTAQTTNDVRLQLRSNVGLIQSVIFTNDLRQWIHLTGVFDNLNDRHILYVNGQPVGTNTYHFGAETFTATKQTIGSYYDTMYQNGVEGFIDEMRVSSSVRPATWIWAEWMNMASNSVFETAGTAQTMPSIQNSGVSNVTSTGATVSGYLSSTGTAGATAILFWGPTDGGVTAGAWANTNVFPDPLGIGTLSTNVAYGVSNSIYYYRYCATNSYGATWADASASFVAGEVTVVATDSSAAEWPQDPATFTFYRPDWSTGVALTVYYAVGGTASNSVDYSSSNVTGNVTFPVGVSNVAITVMPYNDVDFAEPASETVALTFLPGGYLIGSANSATSTIVNRDYVVAYVATNGLNVAPFDTWPKAATNIQAAVDYARTNGIATVQLSNGTFTILGQISVTNAVTVRGMGRTNTIVRRSVATDTAPKHRIFRINHADAVVEALSMQFGHADNTGSSTGTRGGGAEVLLGLVRDCTITNGMGYSASCLGLGIYLDGAGAVASNCVIDSSNGGGNPKGGGAYVNTNALMAYCTLRNYGGFSSTGADGAGAFVNGGTLRWCSVYSNVTFGNGGGGIHVANNANGLVEHCVVTNNASAQNYTLNGVGIYMVGAGTVRNCLVAFNAGNGGNCSGGGLYVNANSVAENCTVINNYAVKEGGGVYAAGGTIRNCIFNDNLSPLSANARTNAGTFVTCLLPGGAPGSGNIDGPPGFVDAANGNYRLSLLSKGLDAGTDQAWMDTVTDLAGGPRKQLAHVDIGAYETPSTFACAFDLSASIGLAPLMVGFTATVVGDNTYGLAYFWDFDGNGSWDDSGTDKQTTSHGYDLGAYRPVLRVTNSVGESASYTGTTAIAASASTLYVATNGTHVAPFDTWVKAATNLQSAVDVAVSGARVVVSNGIYAITASVAIDKAITVDGTNGAAVTTLRRSGTPQFRVLKLNNGGAVVRGLTLQGGYAYELQNGILVDRRGGGACVLAGALTDCTIANSTGTLSTTYGIGVYLDGPGAIASNCVIRSSYGSSNPKGGCAYVNAGAEMTRCTLRDYSGYSSTGADGAGAYVNGGTLRWCNIYGNNCFNNGGLGIYVANNANGLVEYCTVTNNVNTIGGSPNGLGIFMAGAGTVRNCLVGFNTGVGTTYGGGLYVSSSSVAENCTVVNNYAVTDVGGVYALTGAVVRNCIFSGNTAGGTSQDARTNNGTFVTCLLPGGAPGTGNIDGSPTFMGAAARDFRLVPTSLGVNGGTDQPWMTNGVVDLAGSARVQMSRSDIGAYEASGNFTCTYTVSPQVGIAPLTAVFSAAAAGDDTNNLTYYWDFDGNGSWDLTGVDKQTVSNAYALGVYWPVLCVSNGAGQGASYTGVIPVVASLATVYVSTNGSSTSPYDTWAKAATNVQTAVDVAGDGVRVVVSNGTYNLAAYVSIARAITLESVNGATATTLRCTSQTYRVLKLNHVGAMVRGLTLNNGLAYELENGIIEVRRGGGAYVIAGTLADCTITNCYGVAAEGAGFYLTAGLVTNCTVRNCSQSGGASGGVRGIGGHVAGGEVVDCRVSGGQIPSNVFDSNLGGGMHQAGGLLRRCVLFNNRLGRGWGAGLSIAGGLAENCVISNNVTQYGTDGGRGGGVYVAGGTLRNTLVQGNSAFRNSAGAGGGIHQTGGAIENCTVVSNRAADANGTVGGLYATAGSTTNCIFALNSSKAGTLADDVLVTAPATIAHSRAPELTPGVNGNITGDPRFVGAATNNYSLAADSPCLETGANQPWMDTAVDLAGNQRRLGRVDMGAYELRWTGGSVFTFR